MEPFKESLQEPETPKTGTFQQDGRLRIDRAPISHGSAPFDQDICGVQGLVLFRVPLGISFQGLFEGVL